MIQEETNTSWNKLSSHVSPIFKSLTIESEEDGLYNVPKDIGTYVLDDFAITHLRVWGDQEVEWNNPEQSEIMDWIEEISLCEGCRESEKEYSSGQNFGRFRMDSVDKKTHLDAIVWTSALEDVWRPDHYYLQIEEVAQNLLNTIGEYIIVALSEDCWCPGGEQFAFTPAGEIVGNLIYNGVTSQHETKTLADKETQPDNRWTLSPDIAVWREGNGFCS
jgi:hypothetical protein